MNVVCNHTVMYVESVCSVDSQGEIYEIKDNPSACVNNKGIRNDR